ncbi:MAG: NusG domain II-containing protein [Gammaproteobacteria bacterium]
MKRLTRGDIAVLAVAALAVGASYALFWRSGGDGGYALVRSDGETVARFALTGERSVEVPGRLGPSVLEIEPGRIRFAASPCRRKICVHAGWQHAGGATVACLPNGLSLEIVGVERMYDSINF